MANLFAPSLHGDGIRFAFFHHLWNKNRAENEDDAPGSPQKSTNLKNDDKVQLRLPDTIVFRLGQPLQWYFTSERGRRPTILRKRKQNLSVEKIEEVFLRKVKSVHNGWLDSNDIVAYFIASSECTTRNHHLSNAQENGNRDSFVTVGVGEHQAIDNACDIEYFNEEGLHEFLYSKRKNQTGILQRFIEPSGGGTNNSQIRAICTPKMCFLERRKTKQDLHDYRFGLYERAVTFEGPQVYSTSLPIRGTALSGKMRQLCEKVLGTVSEARLTSKRNGDGTKEDIRMVLNLKVDSKERIWILYSSSIRSVSVSSSKYLADIPSLDKRLPKSNDPLSSDDLIKLAPTIKLTQNANHDPSTVISNKKTFESCPSCAKINVGENFHPVPYKTIISHFEQVVAIAGHDSPWPPQEDIIKSAGGVGFGMIRGRGKGGTVNCEGVTEEDVKIPPVIRYLHQRMKVDGYQRYRSDPLFLNKHCKVCEDCFLSYAKLVSTSFQIARPIRLHAELDHLNLGLKSDASKRKGSLNNPAKSLPSSTKSGKSFTSGSRLEKQASFRKSSQSSSVNAFGELFAHAPVLPPAIMEPPPIKLEIDKRKFMPLPYENIESAHQPLIHLINAKKRLTAASKANSKSQATRKSRKGSSESKPKNPYEVPLKFIEAPLPSCGKKKPKRDRSEGDVNGKGSFDEFKDLIAGNALGGSKEGDENWNSDVNLCDTSGMKQSPSSNGPRGLMDDVFRLQLLSKTAADMRNMALYSI